MDTTKSLDPETMPLPATQDIDLEIEELEKITAPKLAANHNETFCSVSATNSSTCFK
jgi:hypothetical protein